jgi:hypothetical protein
MDISCAIRKISFFACCRCLCADSPALSIVSSSTPKSTINYSLRAFLGACLDLLRGMHTIFRMLLLFGLLLVLSSTLTTLSWSTPSLSRPIVVLDLLDESFSAFAIVFLPTLLACVFYVLDLDYPFSLGDLDSSSLRGSKSFSLRDLDYFSSCDFRIWTHLLSCVISSVVICCYMIPCPCSLLSPCCEIFTLVRS